MESIRVLAQQWLVQDRDPSTRKEIEDLLAAHDIAELQSRLQTRIAFGTAGLRASMKAGFAHMNALTVIQASQGLAAYILSHCNPADLERPAVVIGHDARYNSERFARLAAAAFLQNGFSILWFDRLVHTPMVPFAVRNFRAAAGVMVTASHNPKNDNGYKVYWDNGCQIIPPDDAGIAKAIDMVSDVVNWDDTLVDTHQQTRQITSEAIEAYFSKVQALVSPLTQTTKLRFAYTPMHGVGLPFMKRVAAMFAESVEMQVVHAQAKPDPEFPTVPFPNPEEKGALTPAITDAEGNGCSLILANDPDADRFAAVERLQNGKWHQFTGNQMGVLLASYILETYEGDKSELALLASTVSSRMLGFMAKTEGFHFDETLTGFKWLGNTAQRLEREDGYKALYAYEEAIGYMFSDVVYDKDGIAAAAVFLKACLLWHQQGLTPWTKLQGLYKQHGYFEDANTYLISPSPATTNTIFTDIRASNAGSRPKKLGKRDIDRWVDLTMGVDSGMPDGYPYLPVDASAQMITCYLAEGCIVFTARGSGTEPKIKLYIEAQAEDSETAKAMADEVLQDLLMEWFRPEYGLKLAGS